MGILGFWSQEILAISARDLRFRSGFFPEVHCGVLSVAGALVYICAPVGRYQGIASYFVDVLPAPVRV